MPLHGEIKNDHTVTDFGHSVTFETADHAVAYYGPASAFVYTVADRYCAHCEQWITTKGITGRLRFIAHHDSGDCTAKAPA